MISYYFDEHVPKPAATQLQRRGISILYAQADGFRSADDLKLFQRASEIGRVLVSSDKDCLTIAHRLLASLESFSGLVWADYGRMNVGILVKDLELLALVYEPADMENRIEYLPL